MHYGRDFFTGNPGSHAQAYGFRGLKLAKGSIGNCQPVFHRSKTKEDQVFCHWHTNRDHIQNYNKNGYILMNWNRLIKRIPYPRSLLAKVVTGYVVVTLIVGCIIYVGVQEWKGIKSIEMEIRQMNGQKQTVHDAYMKMLELSLFCDTFMEWDKKDFDTYREHKSAIDSLLYDLQRVYPNAHIDSIRMLWKDKEQSMLQIKGIMRKQQQTDREMTGQIPETSTSTGKKKNLLKRLFKKDPKTDNPPNPSVPHTTYRNIVDKRQKYARQFSEQINILASRNRLLNGQLQQVIRHMDRDIQNEMQQRKEKINRAGEQSLAIAAGLAAFMLLMFAGSYIIIQRDMTRINRYKKRLEETIGQLRQTIAENEELIAARKRIMLTMTHDLRTPLTTINSYAELLATEKKASKRKEYNLSIRRVAGHMAAMLNTLLGFFRLESGKEEVDPVPFRLHTIIETLEADFMPLAAEKNLSLNMESSKDRVVIGDKNRIIQIGHNLLSNAIKFTEQGTVTLRMRFDNGTLQFSVEDTGTGMSTEEQARIFTAFERLPNAIAEEGVGLGLSIVKELVGLLGGTIELTSRKGSGSRFMVVLPLSSAEDKADCTREPRPLVQPFTVLVLDNDTVLLAAVKEMLAQHGVMCTPCGNVRDLMERIRHQNYDLLITDLKMPQMNGFDVLKLLRIANVGNSRTIPVIAATASGNCNMADLQEAGFSACLKKPFSAEELLQVCTGCLDGERQQEQVDFHALLKYGNKEEMLETLIRETTDDITAMAESAARNDCESLKEWTHHLSSSWEIIHAGKPLRELFVLLQGTREYSAEEFGQAVRKVLDKGEEIIYLARQEKENYESDCG